MSVELQHVAQIVLSESGIRVRSNQLPALERTLQRVRSGMAPNAFLEALEDARDGAILLERLIEAVTIKETYFLRNRAELESIDWPRRLSSVMARGSHEVRVWNPACATGEESYTLAVLALEALGPKAPVSILATDISPRAIHRAEQGTYGTRALRNVGSTVRARHFCVQGDTLTVASDPRRLLRFATHNLVRDPIPPVGEGPFDVIVCRNVLIYFDPATAARIADALSDALRPDGVLVLGAADALAVTTGRTPARTRPAAKTSAAGKQRQRPPRKRGQGQRRVRSSTATAVPIGGPPRAASIDRAPQNAPDEDLRATLARTDAMLAVDALDPTAHFLRGLAERAGNDALAAVASFRSALYADPGFARCAFELGRTHEALGDRVAAQRSYLSALNALTAGAESQRQLDATELEDLITGCRVRLESLRGVTS